MNNSDYNDFNNWQNGDDNEMNNPNNWNPKGGFFYYGPMSEQFKNLWNNMNNSEDMVDGMKEYLNMNDMLHQWGKELNSKQPMKKQPKSKSSKTEIFAQEDYFKLIEIRGYLAITEQHAHVKALDKLLNQIKIIPKGLK
jgi:hypothetical protein